jgi:putative membrane protein
VTGLQERTRATLYLPGTRVSDRLQCPLDPSNGAAVKNIVRFLLFWGVNTLSLWIADELFDGIAFANTETLVLSGLVLGIVNSFLKPILVILTLPITVLTLGLFLLVINGLTLFLVAKLVDGFQLAGFGTAIGIALAVSIISFFLNALLGLQE